MAHLCQRKGIPVANRIIFGLIVMAMGVRQAAPEQSGAKGRVLIVCDERVQMEALATFLRAKGGLAVEIVDEKGFPAKTDGLVGIYNFVHHTLDERVEKALIDYATGGGRLVSIHHAISSSKTLNKHWLDFCGVALLTGGRTPDEGGWHVVGGGTVYLVNLRPGHYITTHNVEYTTTVAYTPSDSPSIEQRLPAIAFQRSEMFLNQHFTDGRRKTVLFGMMAVDAKTGTTWMQDRGGWYQPTGRGWHFYLQAGHATGDFHEAAFCQVLLNCLTWPGPEDHNGQ